MGLPGPYPAVLHSFSDLFLIKSSSPPSAYRIKSHSPGRHSRPFATGPHLRVHPCCPQPAEASFDSCPSFTCSFIIPSKCPKVLLCSLPGGWWHFCLDPAQMWYTVKKKNQAHQHPVASWRLLPIWNECPVFTLPTPDSCSPWGLGFTFLFELFLFKIISDLKWQE